MVVGSKRKILNFWRKEGFRFTAFLNKGTFQNALYKNLAKRSNGKASGSKYVEDIEGESSADSNSEAEDEAPVKGKGKNRVRKPVRAPEEDITSEGFSHAPSEIRETVEPAGPAPKVITTAGAGTRPSQAARAPEADVESEGYSDGAPDYAVLPTIEEEDAEPAAPEPGPVGKRKTKKKTPIIKAPPVAVSSPSAPVSEAAPSAKRKASDEIPRTPAKKAKGGLTDDTKAPLNAKSRALARPGPGREYRVEHSVSTHNTQDITPRETRSMTGATPSNKKQTYGSPVRKPVPRKPIAPTFAATLIVTAKPLIAKPRPKPKPTKKSQVGQPESLETTMHRVSTRTLRIAGETSAQLRPRK